MTEQIVVLPPNHPEVHSPKAEQKEIVIFKKVLFIFSKRGKKGERVGEKH